MASSYTPNYGLCQWEAKDKVLRTEFNEVNRKVDAVIKTIDDRVTGKADKSELSALQTTVSSHTGALSGKGNCVLYTGAYTGNGKFGADNPRTLTFPGKPWLVAVGGDNGFLLMVQGAAVTFRASAMSSPKCRLTWNGNSVSWYTDSSAPDMNNTSGTVYPVVAFLKADE